MTAPLATYLHDHLAGADLAVALLERLQRATVDAETATLASSLLVEVTEDRESLRRLATQPGAGSTTVKELAAWVSDQALRWKLRADSDDLFGHFETLEFLALGVLGKLHLWQALQACAPTEAETAGLDLGRLIVRAEGQHAALNKRRLQFAALVLHG